MNIPTIHPPGLKKGDTVAIVAPAGPVRQRDALDASIAALEQMGFGVHFGPRIFESSGYLAGSDAARAEELMHAFEDDSIAAVVGLRGGYGCARLIPLLEKSRIQKHPKLFTGFSDLATLHLYFQRHYGWVTVHGPMALNPGIGACPEDQKAHLLSLWTDPGYRPVLRLPGTEPWNHGNAEGRLTGGCLSTIVASIGTPYEIETDGRVLFLEDVSEPPYRIDRMMTHLKLAGKLANPAGIVLGNFHDCPADSDGRSVADVLKETLHDLRRPVLANFPAGHGPDNWALPLGSRVRMDADAGTLEILDAAIE